MRNVTTSVRAVRRPWSRQYGKFLESMKNNPLPRLELNRDIRERLLPYCRLASGGIWQDDRRGHRVACIDATNPHAVRNLVGNARATLAVHDPPYNLVAFEARRVEDYIAW